MHTVGAAVDGQTPLATRRRAEVELDEPALQGPRAGQLKVGETLSGKMLGQDDADKLGAPVGMVTTQRLRLKEDRIVSQALRGWSRAMVSGSGHAVVVQTSLAEQVLNGAKAEVETQGESVAVEPLSLVSLPQGVPDRLVNGARHGGSSCWAGRGLYPYPIPRKTSCPNSAQNVMSGNSSAPRRG